MSVHPDVPVTVAFTGVPSVIVPGAHADATTLNGLLCTVSVPLVAMITAPVTGRGTLRPLNVARPAVAFTVVVPNNDAAPSVSATWFVAPVRRCPALSSSSTETENS